MKNLLMLSGIILLCIPARCAGEQSSTSEDHRSPSHFSQELPLKKSLLEKCILAGKGLGAGAVSTLVGAFCYQNVIVDTSRGSKDSKLFDKVSSLCAAGAAFVCAAKLGTYSIQCAKEVLLD